MIRTKFYITTAIDYVNSEPHIGTAYEKIGADVLARYHRLKGDDTHFLMGTDEHSINVFRKAQEKGISPTVYCDEMEKVFRNTWAKLNISFDDFIRTTQERHKIATQEIFMKIYQNGDIYKTTYKGYYCESCERYYPEKDLVDNKCPVHKISPKWLEEENYFFALSKYQTKLLKYYEKNPKFIVPEIRYNEIINVVRDGLEDISISRASSQWGVPVPIDTGQTIYVWFDALVNYISALGFPSMNTGFQPCEYNPNLQNTEHRRQNTDSLGSEQLAGRDPQFGRLYNRKLPNYQITKLPNHHQPSSFRYWPADLHIIGKDITRFHCIIWPAMLMSVGIELPKQVFGHGFIYFKGEKMSKTLGTVVNPLEIVEKFGADPLRYFLLSENSFGRDGNFTWEGFIKRYNSDLANDLGNLLHRTVNMILKYQSGNLLEPSEYEPEQDNILKIVSFSAYDEVKRLLGAYDDDIEFHNALTAIFKPIRAANKYIDEMSPWKLKKEGRDNRIAAVLYNIFETLRIVSVLLQPFIPETSKKIWLSIGLTEEAYKKIKLEDAGEWGKLPVGITIPQAMLLFPRIET